MITTKQMLGVRDEAALRKRAGEQARRTGADLVESKTPLTAYVNHGRWVADCACGGGVACDPAMSVAVCFGHRDPDDPTGAISVVLHTRIVWPAARAAIESALHGRPMNRNRNWTPKETAADLVRETLTAADDRKKG
jgi:hypothetical protein